MALYPPTGAKKSTAGNLSVRLSDPENKNPMNTVFGEATVGFKLDDISVQFQYNNGPDIIPSNSGTGSITHETKMSVVNSGTGVGSASVVSLDSVRYRPGHEVVTMFTSVYEGTPDANTFAKHGLFNGDNGYYFGYGGTSFGVYSLDNGVESFTPQTSWNVDKLDGNGSSRYNLDPSMMYIYKISFGWLGIAPIFFSVYCGWQKGFVLAHVIDPTGQLAEPTIANPSLPITMSSGRLAGTGANFQVKSSSWRAGVVGGDKEDNASNRRFSFTVAEKTIGTTETPVMSLRSKSTFQGVNNHVKTELMVVRFVTDGPKSVVFVGKKGANLTGASFTDVSTNNSTIQVDSASTVITGGVEGAATVLNKVDSLRSDVRETGLIIYPGETFTITAKTFGASTSTVSVSVRWVEYF